MSTYASVDELTARLSSTYTVPDNAAQLLDKASELIAFATLERSEIAWVSTDPLDDRAKEALTKATCDQVEFWLEVGEEHDVLGLSGSLMTGRVQVQNIPSYLGQRSLRMLLRGGLFYAGAGVRK